MSRTVVPTISRHKLLVIAGVVWTGVGVLLWSRSLIWTADLSMLSEIGLQGASITIAIVAYRFGFSRIVQKNIDRIHTLPEETSPFAFTGVRGYVMILAMSGIGIILRNSALPKVYLALPYSSMGSVLLFGSVSFYRNFARNVQRDEQRGQRDR
jgi:hypothetical protein